MPYTYSPLLVLTSVLIAIIGAYACFDLVIRVQRSRGTQRRQWLVLASLAIGGSIWSMHFIAMIAIQLHQEMRYDGLLTLVSGLVAILMTAVALAIVSTERVSWQQIFLGGLVMGTGIVSMHYVGMFGMRGNFSITHDPIWTAISIIIGIVASTLSLWLVMGLQLRGVLRRLTSAIVMGLSIAGVHYSSMYGTSFEPLADNVAFSRPSLDPVNLGMVVALVTFALLGWTLLTLLPDTPATPLKQNYSRSENHAVEPPRTATAPPHVPNNDLSATLQQQSRPAAPQSQKETKTTVERIPVQQSNTFAILVLTNCSTASL